MPFGINNVTTITMDNITFIGNSSSIPEFMVRVNITVFESLLFFILLWVLWLILFLAAQQVNRDEILHNLMYTGAVVTIASLFIRAIEWQVMGTTYALITDYQLWVFPLITIMIAMVLWMTKDSS